MRIFLFILPFAIIACKTGAQDANISGLTGDPSIGEEHYSADCAACHGADGSGGSGPNIKNASENTLVRVILEGDGSMPAFDYTDQDLADIISYIDGL